MSVRDGREHLDVGDRHVAGVAVGDQSEDFSVEAFSDRARLDETRDARTRGPAGGAVLGSKVGDIGHAFAPTELHSELQDPIR